jgi:hypothetical protein
MGRPAQANARLKSLRERCTIEQRGEKLLLRGHFLQSRLQLAKIGIGKEFF